MATGERAQSHLYISIRFIKLTDFCREQAMAPGEAWCHGERAALQSLVSLSKPLVRVSYVICSRFGLGRFPLLKSFLASAEPDLY